MLNQRAFLTFCISALFLTGCATSAGNNGSPSATIAVSVSPGSPSVRAGSSQLFSATVTGTSNTALTWTVVGGNANGTIDATGNYTAPATLPSPNTVTVQAASQAAPAQMGSTSVTLLNPVPVVTAVTPSTIGTGAFTIVITGSNFVSGATVMFGGTALTTVFNSSTSLSAMGTATPSQAGTVNVTVQNPNPGTIVSVTSEAVTVTTGSGAVTQAAAVRFLEQSTFGPTTTLINQVEQSGFSPFLTAQFASNVSTYADPSATDVMNNNQVPTEQAVFTNALNNPDQLRQRVAFALSEMWVISGISVPVSGIPPYLGLLTQDAFANYRQIMYDITLSPGMGNYLNMANNDKPNAAANTEANQNYARELMQLFTLGVYKLNEDGSLQMSGGNPIPTYTQSDVVQLSNAFTGWTYPTMPGGTLQKHNPQYFLGPMVALDSNHDTTAKTILGTTLAAGQSSAQDLGGTATFPNGALDIIFNNATLPPFVCKQLIEHLVSSNPSTAYVKRVSAVFVSGSFDGFGSGTRGDMQAVIAAILLDPEARRGDLPSTTVATDGHLREPILFIANLLRAFGATSDGAAPVNYANTLGQPVMRANSVFNFYPPDYVIPGSNPQLLGPEFDLQTTATSLARINFVNSYAFSTIGSGTTVSFAPYASMAGTPSTLINTLNALLLHGTMSSSTQASILSAVNAVAAGSNQNTLRAETAIYLIASSSQYQIEQ